jgi:hypothetical protein
MSDAARTQMVSVSMNPQTVSGETWIRNFQYFFAQSATDQNIVPVNLKRFAWSRYHHCLEVIHSDQCIGYILKYCSQNSDGHPLAILWYEKREVLKRQQLPYFVASGIYSQVECSAAINGERHHHLSPSVGFLIIYIESQRVFLSHSEKEAEERLNQSSSLDRYFSLFKVWREMKAFKAVVTSR